MKIGENSLIHFSSNMNHESGIQTLADQSVHLTFTSPPYWNYIDYDSTGGVGKEEYYQDYVHSLLTVFSEVFQKTIEGGRLVVNATNMQSRKAIENDSFMYPIVPDIIHACEYAGWKFFDEIVWHKAGANRSSLGAKPLFGSYPFPPTPKILSSMYEQIVVFVKKGKRPKVDMAIKEQSRVSKEDWNVWTKGIWTVAASRNSAHPATFPFEIAKRIVKMYSFVGDTVLDPFAGSGTTIVTAEKFGRHGIGYEIGNYQEAVKNQIDKHINQMELFE